MNLDQEKALRTLLARYKAADAYNRPAILFCLKRLVPK